ncbi:nucleotide sugar dehydrogenase [Mollisia scopiformis]|uniref:UDP-glucose 6-dehydrogenase n=1 Tax=Mollisia scopiformis TaxID=149040 RepID=A0A194X1X0_MOLSC|nr:nucleotide sugar dehydrogenase [Mollisia scopiformis]KUJ13837.1 nucleotide sugar dehydrogenase [Mollisia scopiformis]
MLVLLSTGGPTAAVIAFHNPNIRVTVVDKDAGRIRRWNSQHPPIHEPGLSEIVRVARDGTNATTVNVEGDFTVEMPARKQNLFFSTDVAKCVSEADIVFLSVNTPTKMTGIGAGAATNMVALEGATRDIAIAAKPGAIIVEKSTVPCRTAQIVRDTLEVHRPGVPFEILSNPEFLAEGTAIKDLLNPDRILIGSSRTKAGLAAAATLEEVYSAWVDRSRIVIVNLWSSELSKLVANAMLAQRISSINTVSAICEKTGADVDEIAKAIGRDARLGSKFLKAGLGFGGSCFKKDILSLVYLAQTLNLEEVADYWMQVITINEFQRNRFVKRVVSNLHGTLIGRKISILGYAFKKDTSDTRESPAVEVVKSLLADNPAEIAIFDPRCNPEDVKDEIKRLFATTGLKLLKPDGPIEVYKDSYEACHDASAVLILTEWDQFRYPPLKEKESAFHKEESIAAAAVTKPTLGRTPSELDILNMMTTSRHTKPSSPSPTPNATELAPPLSTDPLNRYLPEPECPAGCRDCERGQVEEVIANENIEWERISYGMRKPKWVFDGRGLVDVVGMEKLGFRVEGIGKAAGGSRSRLHGECFSIIVRAESLLT